MKRARFLALLSLAAVATVVGGCGESHPPREPVATETQPSPSSAEVARPRSPGRPAAKPKAETLAAARNALSNSGTDLAEGSCGPYQVLSSAPAEYLSICESLAAELDSIYQARLGVSIPNPPEGLIVIFGAADGYRDFAKEFGRLRAGYAGFTLASRGVVALLADGVPAERFATVLGHELTHLVHRRVFGPNLDPWLSEGLADALGDTATPSGFGGLTGIAGIEPLADRLHRAIEAGHTESLAAVVAKSRREFDRGTVSYDYESSALLTRYLLLEPAMAQRFRDLLRKLAAAKSRAADCVLESLEVTPEQLDREFRAWLAAHGS